MCGVFFSSRTEIADKSIESIKESLTCRGPDKQQILKTQFGVFCQTRLEIIGLGKCGDQPFSENFNEDCLVYNGEIYNFRSFCKVLNFETTSDTEILYRILKLKRYELISQIRGMYSFIYYNFKEEYILTARDFFGIKPLYCLNANDGEISFASVPSVLLKIAKNKEIDLISVCSYLATGVIHNGYSMFKSIKKVLPGNLERWNKTNGQWNAEVIELKKYRHEYLSERESILNSVSIHLTSEVPVGVLMSGGVDSTLLAALASKEVPNLKTYSLINPKFPQINEAKYALHNSMLIGTDHHEVEFNMSDSLEQLIKIINSTAEPFSDAAYIPLSILCREVSKDLKVVLAGEGADEIFSGYRRYDIENLFKNKTIKNITQKILCRLFGSDFYLNNSPDQFSRIISFIIEENFMRGHGKLLFAEWEAVFDLYPGNAGNAFNLERIKWQENISKLEDRKIEDYRAYDLFIWLSNVLLEKSDRASMLSGLEVRVPFLDKLVWQNINQNKIKGTKKEVLRNILYEQLPMVRLPKKKLGLSVVKNEINEHKDFKIYFEKLLNTKNSLIFAEKNSSNLLNRRINMSPEFKFRLLTLAIWQDIWL